MSVYLQTNQVVTIQDAAAYAVSPADTGKTIMLRIMSQGCTITLPALAAGLHYRIQTPVAGAALAFDVAVTASAGLLLNGVITFPGATPVAVTDNTSITFLTAGTPCAIGDSIDCYCDGTRWSVLGYSRLNGGLAVA